MYEFHNIRFYSDIFPKVYKYCLQHYKRQGIIDEASKGVTIKHLVHGSLYLLVFPLLPLAEQKRIVTEIEELIPLCEHLK